MARHVNQRALTVNTARVNAKPQPRPPEAPRISRRVLEGLDYTDELDDFQSPHTLGINFHLLLTGQFRAGRF